MFTLIPVTGVVTLIIQLSTYPPSTVLAVITVLPLDFACTFPLWSTLAIKGLKLSQTTLLLVASGGAIVTFKVSDWFTCKSNSFLLSVTPVTGTFLGTTFIDATDEAFPSADVNLKNVVPTCLAFTVAEVSFLLSILAIVLLSIDQVVSKSVGDFAELNLKLSPTSNSVDIGDIETDDCDEDTSVILMLSLI